MERRESQFATEYERFMALSDEEKAKDVAKFDAEFVADKARPLTAKERRQWKAPKRGDSKHRK